jgi:hypothetical protein
MYAFVMMVWALAWPAGEGREPPVATGGAEQSSYRL